MDSYNFSYVNVYISLASFKSFLVNDDGYFKINHDDDVHDFNYHPHIFPQPNESEQFQKNEEVYQK